MVPASAQADRRPMVDVASPGWQLLDLERDGVPGVSAVRAYEELAAAGRPSHTIVVAIIDVGFDTTVAALRTRLWVNPRERIADGRDADGDGRVDDVHGWNFLGAPDGRTAHADGLEVTRLWRRCAAHSGSEVLAPGLPPCDVITADYEAQRTREASRVAVRVALLDSLHSAVELFARAFSTDRVATARVASLPVDTDSMGRARDLFLRVRERIRAWPTAELAVADVARERARVLATSGLVTTLDPAWDPRAIVGDHPDDATEQRYGNGDVMGRGLRNGHGTHLAGIIGAAHAEGPGPVGVADDVRLMLIHATSDGDERDKDVANAIRYAVDHGARIVNMSFGKAYSPDKGVVDDAVRHAATHDVLIVHSAGNDAADVDRTPTYPSPTYLDGTRAPAWIEVGASSSRVDERLAASFSNFGSRRVDVFAPGVDITSTALGGGTERRSGTSQAAPVVAGVAALLWSRYPELHATDVARILRESAVRLPDLMVLRPGGARGEQVRFGDLSRSGGVVNALAAVRAVERARLAR